MSRTGRGRALAAAAVAALAGGCADPPEPAPDAGAVEAHAVLPEREAAAPAPLVAPPSAAGAIPPRLLAPWRGDFDGMVERRYLRVLVAPSKTFYFVEEGRPRGTVYELFKAFEEEIDRRLGGRRGQFHVVFVPTSRAAMIPGLVEGRGDVAAAGLTVTEERSAQVEFSRPLWSDIDQVAVTGPASPPLASLDDLAGREVLVRRSSSYWEHLERLDRSFAARGLAPIVRRAAPEDLEDEDLLELLNAGAFEVAVVNEPIATLWARVLPEIRVHREIVIHSGGEIAWMMRRGSPRLKAELDAFAATRGKGSLVGNTLMKRYVGSSEFVARSTSPAELAKFRALVSLFERYGRQYDVDHLLAMAQGYQESRLDQSVRSRVGAIGVMQIMPDTAAELATGDVRELEPNVHAGVKYIRFMIDHYYRDEAMTRVDKQLFAFASYNAGPARIARLRRQAAARGLDPNLWFNNVELEAADEIGPETVTYVSNIYKYYVAYKLVAERERAREAARAAVGRN